MMKYWSGDWRAHGNELCGSFPSIFRTKFLFFFFWFFFLTPLFLFCLNTLMTNKGLKTKTRKQIFFPNPANYVHVLEEHIVCVSECIGPKKEGRGWCCCLWLGKEALQKWLTHILPPCICFGNIWDCQKIKGWFGTLSFDAFNPF